MKRKNLRRLPVGDAKEREEHPLTREFLEKVRIFLRRETSCETLLVQEIRKVKLEIGKEKIPPRPEHQ